MREAADEVLDKLLPPARVVGTVRRLKERVRGIEPPSPAWKAGALPLSYTRLPVFRVLLSGREDSNLRPPAPKAGALPGCATPRGDRDEYSKAVGGFK